MIHTIENKFNCLKNDIFNTQIKSVKILLFVTNLNKGTMHNILLFNTGYLVTHHIKHPIMLNARSYPIILNAPHHIKHK